MTDFAQGETVCKTSVINLLIHKKKGFTIGQVVATQKFAYKNPTFKWNAQTNKAVHFQANLLNRKVISDFPPHAEIHVSYKNRTIHHFAFTQFIRTTNTTYDRFK
uniref:Uncharacterized protein n=1 Tax=Panagrolaimus superbus TaxID=310955 RepID=A0A914YBJ8_9BILA